MSSAIPYTFLSALMAGVLGIIHACAQMTTVEAPLDSVNTVSTSKKAVFKKADAEIDSDSPRLVEIYKDIHQHPELGFMERRTAGVISKELKTLGFEVHTGIAKTGVVGILRNGSGPTVMYRADMDANAVEELSELPYASKARVTRDDGSETPVGHMCGHDAHVTWMLGMAKAMASMKQDWSGTLVLVAQPAEELGLGAKGMVDDGLYTRYKVPVPDYLIGLHTAPGPTGVVANVGGVRMAGSDQVDILFRGVGGHGSMPQFTKDPVIMAALAVVEYQMIVSRVVDPQETAVLTVGSIQAGSDNNVIPGEALLKANLRWFHEKVREQMIGGIKNISNSIATAYGVAADQMPVFTIKGSTTPLINDPGLVARLSVPLKELLGDKNVVTEFPPATGSEDIPLLMGDHTIPLDFIFVGIAEPNVFAEAIKQGKSVPYSVHNGDFRVDLKAIPIGAKIATITVLDLLEKGAPKP